jgi:hypothetical protein
MRRLHRRRWCGPPWAAGRAASWRAGALLLLRRKAAVARATAAALQGRSRRGLASARPRPPRACRAPGSRRARPRREDTSPAPKQGRRRSTPRPQPGAPAGRPQPWRAAPPPRRRGAAAWRRRCRAAQAAATALRGAPTRFQSCARREEATASARRSERAECEAACCVARAAQAGLQQRSDTGAQRMPRRENARRGPRKRPLRRATRLTASATGAQSGNTPAAGISASTRPGAAALFGREKLCRSKVPFATRARPSASAQPLGTRWRRRRWRRWLRSLTRLTTRCLSKGCQPRPGLCWSRRAPSAAAALRCTALCGASACTRLACALRESGADVLALCFALAAASRPGAHHGAPPVAQAARRQAGARAGGVARQGAAPSAARSLRSLASFSARPSSGESCRSPCALQR